MSLCSWIDHMTKEKLLIGRKIVVESSELFSPGEIVNFATFFPLEENLQSTKNKMNATKEKVFFGILLAIFCSELCSGLCETSVFPPRFSCECLDEAKTILRCQFVSEAACEEDDIFERNVKRVEIPYVIAKGELCDSFFQWVIDIKYERLLLTDEDCPIGWDKLGCR